MEFEITNPKFPSTINIKIINGEPWLYSNDLNIILPFIDLKKGTFVTAFHLLAKAIEILYPFETEPYVNDPDENGDKMLELLSEVFCNKELSDNCSDIF